MSHNCLPRESRPSGEIYGEDCPLIAACSRFKHGLLGNLGAPVFALVETADPKPIFMLPCQANQKCHL